MHAGTRCSESGFSEFGFGLLCKLGYKLYIRFDLRSWLKKKKQTQAEFHEKVDSKSQGNNEVELADRIFYVRQHELVHSFRKVEVQIK